MTSSTGIPSIHYNSFNKMNLNNIQLTGVTSKQPFLNEFVVDSVEMEDPKNRDNGKAVVLLVGEGRRLKMHVTLKEGQKDGKAVILRENNTLFMETSFVKDIATGELVLYDEMGNAIERGELKNGVKNGVFQRFDERGIQVDELHYRNGTTVNDIKESQKMPGFFEERSEEGELRCISQYASDKITRDGICYEMEGGKVKQKSLYVNGEMKQIMTEVKGDEMVEYDSTGKRVYEGGYVFDEEKGLMREGKGTEYMSDGESALYVGFFHRGQRNGKGTLFNGFSPLYIGEWKDGKRHGIGKEMDSARKIVKNGAWINDSFDTQKTNTMIALNPEKEEYHVKSNQFNSDTIQFLFFPCNAKLKRISIGDKSFAHATRFVLDGLNELETVKIGVNSLTLKEDSIEKRLDRECSIVNCPKLKHLEFGDGSFSDYAVFEVKGLPSLKSISLGKYAFYFASICELKGENE